jgi:hypothetical protein
MRSSPSFPHGCSALQKLRHRVGASAHQDLEPFETQEQGLRDLAKTGGGNIQSTLRTFRARCRASRIGVQSEHVVNLRRAPKPMRPLFAVVALCITSTSIAQVRGPISDEAAAAARAEAEAKANEGRLRGEELARELPGLEMSDELPSLLFFPALSVRFPYQVIGLGSGARWSFCRCRGFA